MSPKKTIILASAHDYSELKRYGNEFLQMNNVPLVTVAMPAFNHEAFVAKAVESVMDLNYDNLEFIIVNDGSEDKTDELLKSFLQRCHKRFVRFEYKNRENRGLTQTLNECLAWAKGKYFMPLASDDIVLPNKLKQLVPLLEADCNVAAVFGSLIKISSDGQVLQKCLGLSCIHSFEDLLMHKNIPPAPGAVIRKKAIIEIGGYDPEIRIEDWYLWLKLAEKKESVLLSIPDYVAKYRIHENNTIKNWKFMYEHRKRVLELFHKNPLYPRALSKIKLLSAHDAIDSGHMMASLKLLREAKFEPPLVKMRYLLKILFPKHILKVYKHIRSAVGYFTQVEN